MRNGDFFNLYYFFMKNRFQILTAELDDYRRECYKKNRIAKKPSRHFVKAKSNIQSFLNQIKEKRRFWSEKNIHGMSLFDGIKLLNDHLKTRYESMWQYFSEYEQKPEGVQLIQVTLEKSREGERLIRAAIIKNHKNSIVSNLRSNILRKETAIRNQVAEIKKYQKVFDKYKERAKPFEELKKYGSDITKLTVIGDKAMKWAMGKTGGPKASLFTVSPKSIKSAVDNFANSYLQNITSLTLRLDARKFLGSSYSSMEEITQEYIDLVKSMTDNKERLDKLKAQLKMSTGQSTMMSDSVGSDNEFVLDILEFFFKERLKENQLNSALKELAANILWTATKASKAMDMIPRPPKGVPSPKWLIQESVKIAYRVVKNKGIYEAVRKTVALKWRTAFELARMGISPGNMSSAYSYSIQNRAGQMSLSEIKSLVESVQFSNIPLDPVTGGMSIPVSTLRPGDIILSTTNSHISKAIRKMTSSPVSHSILYIGDNKVIEAIGSGVVMRSIDDALKDASLAVAFEHPNITNPQINRIIDFAKSKIGKKYDKVGIVRQAGFQIDKKTICERFSDSGRKAKCINWVGKINLGTSTNDEFFCSELILAAYQNAGLPLTITPPHWNSPEDIAELRLNKKLKYVGHLIS